MYKMEFKVLYYIIIIVVMRNVCQVGAEFYSSMHAMEKLLEYEKYFLRQTNQYLILNEKKLELLKEWLGEFSKYRDEANLVGPTYFENPVNKYLLTKRLTVDWERIENFLQYHSGHKILDKMEKFKEAHILPDEKELEGAIEGLIRLQTFYRLPTKDIVEGILQEVPYNVTLRAQNCYDIGKWAIENDQTRLGYSWIIEGLRLLESEDSEPLEAELEKWELLLSLMEAQFRLKDLAGANKTLDALLEIFPENEGIAWMYEKYSTTLKEEIGSPIDLNQEHLIIPKNVNMMSAHERFKLTCSGYIEQSAEQERDLRCRLLSTTHPFLILAPIKMEELNLDPLMVVYYDVLYDSEIEYMKKLGSNTLQRASILSANGSIVSSVRTSQFAFVSKENHKVLQIIDRRVEDMTNLNMNCSEHHQFANYGIGGHYDAHHDYFAENAFSKGYVSQAEGGNRIATVLFYMSDVEQGGGTGFPYLKRLLMPIKGAAAFWYNLHASGERDERSLHGACPIIVGSKWVQNRWIREYGQFDRRPCKMFNDRVNGPF